MSQNKELPGVCRVCAIAGGAAAAPVLHRLREGTLSLHRHSPAPRTGSPGGGGGGSTAGGLSCPARAGGKPPRAVNSPNTAGYCCHGDRACRNSTGLPSEMQLHPSPLVHCSPWGGWISHTQPQQFGTGINTTRAFLKEKNSLRQGWREARIKHPYPMCRESTNAAPCSKESP